MTDLHNTFLERLEALTIQSNFSEEIAGTLLRALSFTKKITYLSNSLGIKKDTVIGWYRGNSKTVPKADTLLLISQHFHVSVDYLLGNTDLPEDYTEQYIHDYTGLEYEAIAMLHQWKELDDEDEKSLFHAQKMQSLKALNEILSDKYKQEQKGFNGWDVLHFIGSYLISDKIIREKGYARFKGGGQYPDLEQGDTVIKGNTKESFVVDYPLVTERITNDNKKIGVYEEEHAENRYVLPLSDLYKAHSLKSIGILLDKIIERNSQK